jgi:hypothetical protein
LSDGWRNCIITRSIIYTIHKKYYNDQIKKEEISGSHGGEYEDDSLLGYSAV